MFYEMEIGTKDLQCASAEELAAALNNGMAAEEVEKFVKGDYLAVFPSGDTRWRLYQSGSSAVTYRGSGMSVVVIGPYDLLITKED